MSRLQHVFTFRSGDREKIEENIRLLKEKSNEELIASYNKQAELGIVGAHAQALYLVALYREFTKRFGESPVEIIDNRIIRLKGRIRLEGNSFQFTEIYEYEN